jgi:recombination protein RecA
MTNVIQDIIKKYGERSIQKLGDASSMLVPVIPTGSLMLDIALGVGGFPRGRITELLGAFQSGKSTLCLHTIAQCQALGGQAAVVDSEHALDTSWAQTIGVNVKDLWVTQPDYGEQSLDIIEMLVSSGDFDLVVLDSVAALLPKAELEGEIGDSHMALTARLMSQAMRKLSPKIKSSDTAVIFTNQLRQNIGVMFGPNTVSSGGEALKYYASIRVETSKRTDIKEANEAVGTTIKARVSKNKVAPPFKTAEFVIRFDSGIDFVNDVVTLALEAGFLEKTGAGWYTLGEQKVQGLSNLREFLLKDKEGLRELENKVRTVYGLPIRC